MSAAITDIEITKRCAAAMGYTFGKYDDNIPLTLDNFSLYDPLSRCGQAFALAERFKICWQYCDTDSRSDKPWRTYQHGGLRTTYFGADLKRAICLCVAQMKLAKEAK